MQQEQFYQNIGLNITRFKYCGETSKKYSGKNSLCKVECSLQLQNYVNWQI